MPRRCCLLCSLPLVTLSLLAVAGPVRGAVVAPFHSDAPSKLIDVKDEHNPSTLLFDNAPNDPTWTMAWSDLGVTDDAAPRSGAAGGIEFARLNVRPPQAPPVIAAPLPPAIVPGLVGLVGVYYYKRRHRLR